MTEQAIFFGVRQSLTGIVTEPVVIGGARVTKAVILLNAGIVHRVGPGRIYVRIARELAAMGFVVLRLTFPALATAQRAMTISVLIRVPLLRHRKPWTFCTRRGALSILCF